MEKIASQNKKIIVSVHYVEEQFKTTLQLNPVKRLKEIYPLVAVRVKVRNFWSFQAHFDLGN